MIDEMNPGLGSIELRRAIKSQFSGYDGDMHSHREILPSPIKEHDSYAHEVRAPAVAAQIPCGNLGDSGGKTHGGMQVTRTRSTFEVNHRAISRP